MALADVDSKQWEPLMDLFVSLPPDLAADRPSWLGAAAPRLARKVTFASLTRAQCADVARLYTTGVPVRDVCARFNITKNTVIRLRKQAGAPNGNVDVTSLKGTRPKRCTPPTRPSRPSPATTTRPGACGQPEAPEE